MDANAIFLNEIEKIAIARVYQQAKISELPIVRGQMNIAALPERGSWGAAGLTGVIRKAMAHDTGRRAAAIPAGPGRDILIRSGRNWRQKAAETGVYPSKEPT